MALFRCSSGDGSTPQETTLWTNNSPTSNFSDQTITLSDDITNYDYLKLVWVYSTANQTENEMYINVRDLINDGGNTVDGNHYLFGARGTVWAARYITYVSNTSVYISVAYRLNAATTYTNSTIPLKIVGIKL